MSHKWLWCPLMPCRREMDEISRLVNCPESFNINNSCSRDADVFTDTELVAIGSRNGSGGLRGALQASRIA
ncbi:hypothetical protein EmuJ_000564600 [Echinococcus multilocularis]|uniref:Uncharacterized protein n=1 Tax=Echinococcus multilocularis TaxID=6211 RepID=A0A068Y7U2_ECHMU|nr:hypothetical protein EmuJ_000564600 [Echinococcus multilocularis]